jgi:hypothetical protein
LAALVAVAGRHGDRSRPGLTARSAYFD